MEKHNLIKELRALHIRELEIKGELKAFLSKQVDIKRQFSDGEKVAVYDEYGKFCCNGIIKYAFIYQIDDHEVKSCAENEEKYKEFLNNVRYRVCAIKQDGTISLKNATPQKSLGLKDKNYGYYIQKIKA